MRWRRSRDQFSSTFLQWTMNVPDLIFGLAIQVGHRNSFEDCRQDLYPLPCVSCRVPFLYRSPLCSCGEMIDVTLAFEQHANGISRILLLDEKQNKYGQELIRVHSANKVDTVQNSWSRLSIGMWAAKSSRSSSAGRSGNCSRCSASDNPRWRSPDKCDSCVRAEDRSSSCRSTTSHCCDSEWDRCIESRHSLGNSQDAVDGGDDEDDDGVEGAEEDRNVPVAAATATESCWSVSDERAEIHSSNRCSDGTSTNADGKRVDRDSVWRWR